MRTMKWQGFGLFVSLALVSGCGGTSSTAGAEEGAIAESAAAVTNCTIAPEKELVITDVGVVGDARAQGMGPWSIGGLMTAMAGTNDPQAFVKTVVESWLTPQIVDGIVIPARTKMQSVVLDSWPKTASGDYDLAAAPMQLLAIVYRVDLRKKTNVGDKAGEGRFVMGVKGLRSDGTIGLLPFTMILEFGLMVREGKSALDWAKDWHSLGELPIGSEEYNARLQAITDQFASVNAAAGQQAGTTLNQLRTNEIALTFPPVPSGEPSFLWQLREFHIDADGMLRPAQVALTPSFSLNGTTLLGDYVAHNVRAIEEGTQKVPTKYKGTTFGGAASETPPSFKWTVPGVTQELADAFSAQTCSGCHAGNTDTKFLHIGPDGDDDDAEADLSDFVKLHEIPSRVDELKSVLGCL